MRRATGKMAGVSKRTEEKRISEKEARMEIKDTFASPHNYH